jgi:hypothetical protein
LEYGGRQKFPDFGSKKSVKFHDFCDFSKIRGWNSEALTLFFGPLGSFSTKGGCFEGVRNHENQVFGGSCKKVRFLVV